MTILEKVKAIVSKKWVTTAELNTAVGSSSGERRLRDLKKTAKVMSKKENGVNKYKLETTTKKVVKASKKKAKK